MTTELVLLLGMFGFILGGVFLGESGPRRVFANSAPRLGAHVERQLSIGNQFVFENGEGVRWLRPNGPAPLGVPQ